MDAKMGKQRRIGMYIGADKETRIRHTDQGNPYHVFQELVADEGITYPALNVAPDR